MALRVLSGIKVPMIGSIVVLAIRKCAADPSPYVRKAAAFAIPKCYRYDLVFQVGTERAPDPTSSLDTSHLPELISIITTLLKDQSPLSIGNTAVAFEAVCPTRLDLLHLHYRRLCRTLADVDEWGQVNLLSLLVRYVRTMLPKPADSGEDIDPDLQLLLSSSEPLFMSRNPAVGLFYECVMPTPPTACRWS
jgi:AP-3 complex subunit beta